MFSRQKLLFFLRSQHIFIVSADIISWRIVITNDKSLIFRVLANADAEQFAVLPNNLCKVSGSWILCSAINIARFRYFIVPRVNSIFSIHLMRCIRAFRAIIEISLFMTFVSTKKMSRVDRDVLKFSTKTSMIPL